MVRIAAIQKLIKEQITSKTMVAIARKTSQSSSSKFSGSASRNVLTASIEVGVYLCTRSLSAIMP